MHPPSQTLVAGDSPRIPSLDGLRALSILAVILAHAQGTRGFPEFLPLQVFGDLGNLGVRVFFVISGFLITSLLFKERERTGRISLTAFYLRRTFRIFPAFYVYVLTITVLSTAGLIVAKTSDLVFAATYTINYVAEKSWVLAHLWSLAVEEQFYLLWPMVLCLAGPRRALRIASLVLVAAPVCRIAAWYLLPEHHRIITKAFPTIADALAVGCVLAIARDTLFLWPPYNRLLRSRLMVFVPLVVVLTNTLASHTTRPDYLVGQTIRNIAIAICVDWCARYPVTFIGRILNHRLMVFLGVLSYSLYLWQQLFLNRYSDALLTSFPINVTAAFAAAAASYYLVERPFLRLKTLFTPERVSIVRVAHMAPPQAAARQRWTSGKSG